MDRAVAITHMLAFQLQTRIWWEYVPSSANWSDGISRLLGHDPWAAEQGFVTREVDLPVQLWLDSLAELWARIRTALGKCP